ncbi:hypothetical protein DH86_00001759, partial [Scytalidium sp. 3C]
CQKASWEVRLLEIQDRLCQKNDDERTDHHSATAAGHAGRDNLKRYRVHDRPRNRRESVASSTAAGSSRIRKNSVASGSTMMRPRANTISHVDAAHLPLMGAANIAPVRPPIAPGHSRHASLVGLPMHNHYQYDGMSAAMSQRGTNHALPKLETNGFNNVEFGGGLRTAPVIAFNNDFDIEGLFFGPGSTINPNALHYQDSPQSMAIDSTSPFNNLPDMSASQVMEENFDWINGFDHQMSFNAANENAIDGSSPSAISTASQSGISEVMLDGSNNPAAASTSMWQQSMIAPALMTSNPFAMDMSTAAFPDLLNNGPLSPNSLPQKNTGDPYFSTPPPSMSSLSPSMMPGLTAQNIHQSINFGGPETPISMNGSMHASSPVSTLTDATRQALLAALAHCQPFGGRKYSFPAASSPLSPHFPGRMNGLAEASRTLPSTHDLQRYCGAYIRYFHPHLPFLHIPTLTFELPLNSSSTRGNAGLVGGRGCLILSMAAIGALYELEHAQSKELFESAKKMIQLYLEERRKADVRKADIRKAGIAEHTSNGPEYSVHTPVWLVQAMLLNVVYGHNCGDKIAADIASTHCAALVSLARAAELLKPQPVQNGNQDVQMNDDGMSPESWNGIKTEIPDDQQEWYSWKNMEERKRTLYAVFILSSLLVSAYNHTPALTNSEITLDLPCDEEFWVAENANSFHAKGGARMANHNQITFHDALGELLRASEKQQQLQQMQRPYAVGMNPDLPQTDLRPSTFGCLVLINALHNYIWETRQRHHNKIWTNEETEKMHRHIEPALKAWQAAWASNPHHSLERPNPYGLGPLSADSIPLLDLAYVRLFVNLSRSKEKFWQRDWDGMAEELSRGSEIIQHAEHSPSSNIESADPSDASGASSIFVDSPPTSTSSPDFNSSRIVPNSMNQLTNQDGSTTKRERHLRKAAFYAADSLSMSDKLGVTFADFTSRELPLQSALCAFDCAQVLAEWVATVQERVGRYLGILGKDDINLNQVPGIMLLEEEDVKLLSKIQEVLNSAEIKMNYELASMGGIAQMSAAKRIPTSDNCGYAAKILRVTAYMLDKAAVWPVTHLMAHSLETQANHMRARAEESVAQRE